MAVPVWQPGTLYRPGTLVRPRTAPPVGSTQPANANFEGTGGWSTSTPSIAIQNPAQFRFDGTGAMVWAGTFYVESYGTGYFWSDTAVPVRPGQTINAQCRHRRGTDNFDRQGCKLGIEWLDASQDPISVSYGAQINSGRDGPWFTLTASGAAPANAAFARLRVDGFNRNDGGNHPMWWDAFTWDYVYAAPPEGLVFRAVQAEAGFSGNTEPAWPTLPGQTVVDNEVTWEAVTTSRVVWEAHPILVSGATEPTWPTAVGAEVADNTIAWRAISRRIEDPRCPQSKVVAIAASKIFAGDNDIIAFSATVNPLDWSTPEDAGYLPFGLQTYGANPVQAMGLYRGNLVAFNSMGFQMWQVDEDPQNMALLDAVPIGSTYHESLQPVANDLVFLTDQGIRNIGIAGASTNLQAGEFGKAIDPLVQEALATGATARALYVPAFGQYWLFVGAQAFVLTINGGPQDMSWSRYTFPAAIDAWTILDNDLYLRAGDLIWRVSDEALVDDEGGNDVPFEGEIRWPYLELGALGRSKLLHGFDLVCQGQVHVSFGFDQSNEALATPEYPLDGETLPGGVIAMPVCAPSVQMRLRFSGGQKWEWMATCLYVDDQTGRP